VHNCSNPEYYATFKSKGELHFWKRVSTELIRQAEDELQVKFNKSCYQYLAGIDVAAYAGHELTKDEMVQIQTLDKGEKGRYFNINYEQMTASLLALCREQALSFEAGRLVSTKESSTVLLKICVSIQR